MAWVKETWIDDDGSLTVGTLYTAGRMNNIEAGNQQGKETPVKHDASSTPTAGTGNLSWEHAPLSLGVKGVMVMVVQNVRTAIPLQVTKVTYGGIELPRVSILEESGRASIGVYFLGTDIPPITALGKKVAVVVTVSGAANKSAICCTVTAPRDTRPLLAGALGTSKISGSEIVPHRESAAVYGVTTTKGDPTPAVALAFQKELMEVNLGTSEAKQYMNVVEFQAEEGFGLVETASTGVGCEWTTAESLGWGAVICAIGMVRDWGIVTALPTKPGIGDKCEFKAAEGIYWNCVYTGETTYPWAVVSGPPLRKQETASPSWATTIKTESAPSITLPAVKMEFDVEYGSSIAFSTGTLANARLIVFINEVEQADNVRTYAKEAGQPVAHKTFDRTATASQVVRLKYICESFTGSASTGQMYMAIHPKRIG